MFRKENNLSERNSCASFSNLFAVCRLFFVRVVLAPSRGGKAGGWKEMEVSPGVERGKAAEKQREGEERKEGDEVRRI